MSRKGVGDDVELHAAIVRRKGSEKGEVVVENTDLRLGVTDASVLQLADDVLVCLIAVARADERGVHARASSAHARPHIVGGLEGGPLGEGEGIAGKLSSSIVNMASHEHSVTVILYLDDAATVPGSKIGLSCECRHRRRPDISNGPTRARAIKGR